MFSSLARIWSAIGMHCTTGDEYLLLVRARSWPAGKERCSCRHFQVTRCGWEMVCGYKP